MKATLSIFFVIAVTTCTSERISDQKCKNYITSTTNADTVLKEFPHIVLLLENKNSSLVCSAALISESYVLTAAHCLKNRSGKSLRLVLLGSKNSKSLDHGSKIVNILNTIPHPEYNPTNHKHDIGLVQIETISTFTETIRPACLYTGIVKDDQKLEDTAWARESRQIYTMIKFQSEIVPHNKCASLYEKMHIALDADIDLCANAKNIDDFRGLKLIGGVTHINEGGHWKIAALSAFGQTIPTADFPDVYTKIYPHMEWIEKTVWG